MPRNRREKCLLPPRGWYCTRGPGHEGPCAALPDKWELESDMDRLIQALERGSYDTASANLSNGSPLKVESLEATMRVVTFDVYHLMPWVMRRYARRCARAAKVCHFFRLKTWEDLFKRAEASFIADANHADEVRRNRFESCRRPEAESPSETEPR